MLEAEGVELGGEIRLVAENAFLRVTLRAAAVKRVRKNCSGVGNGRIPVDMAVAQRITQVEYVIEAVIQPDCADIDQCLFIILFGQTVKIARGRCAAGAPFM